MFIFRVLYYFQRIFLEPDKSIAERRWFVPLSLKGGTSTTRHIWETFCLTLKVECSNNNGFCVKCQHCSSLNMQFSYSFHCHLDCITVALFVLAHYESTELFSPKAKPHKTKSSYSLVRISEPMLFPVRAGGAYMATDTALNFMKPFRTHSFLYQYRKLLIKLNNLPNCYK